MKTRSRLIAAAAFAVVAAGLVALIVFGDLGASEDADVTPTAGPEMLWPEDQAEVVTAFRLVDNQTGEAVEATSEDGMTWSVEELPEGAPGDLPPDDNRISMAMFELPGLLPSRVLSGIEAMAPYGLEDPRYTLSYRLTSGEERTLYIGEESPTATGIYVRLTEDINAGATVYLIPPYALSPVIGFVDDPPLLYPTPTPDAGEGTDQSPGGGG
jgi:hypothetical protein